MKGFSKFLFISIRLENYRNNEQNVFYTVWKSVLAIKDPEKI